MNIGRRKRSGGALVIALLATMAGQTTIAHAKPTGCRPPRVLGDGPWWASEQVRRADCDVRLEWDRHSRLGSLVVLSQSVAPGRTVEPETTVRLRLGRRPPTPRGCSPPPLTRVLTDSPSLVAWVDPVREAPGYKSHGEGPQSYVACVPPSGRKHVFFVAESDLTSYTELIALRTAGRFIAVAGSDGNHYGDGERGVRLYDAARGRYVFEVGWSIAPEQPVEVVPTAVAVTAEGDIAWIRKTYTQAPGGTFSTVQTVTLRQAGVRRDLESAQSITKLEFGEGRLRWQSEGVARSTPIG